MICKIDLKEWVSNILSIVRNAANSQDKKGILIILMIFVVVILIIYILAKNKK